MNEWKAAFLKVVSRSSFPFYPKAKTLRYPPFPDTNTLHITREQHSVHLNICDRSSDHPSIPFSTSRNYIRRFKSLSPFKPSQLASARLRINFRYIENRNSRLQGLETSSIPCATVLSICENREQPSAQTSTPQRPDLSDKATEETVFEKIHPGEDWAYWALEGLLLSLWAQAQKPLDTSPFITR